MKTLYLWRHAKSDWGSIDLDDHDRALSTRGNTDAPRMAAVMKEQGYVPEKILCSTARRTHQTLNHLQNVIGTNIPVSLDQSLYLAPPQILLKAIRSAKDIGSVMIIAHNPGLEDLATQLCSADGPTTPNFPTCGFAVFEFEIENWKEAAPGTGMLKDFLTPKTLAAQ